MYIVCDIGGTKMRIARADTLVGLQGGLIANADTLAGPPQGHTGFTRIITIPTPPVYEQGVKVLVQNILNLQESQQDTIDACIIGIAGTLDRDKSELYNGPNLMGWQHKPLRRRLENELHTHIHLENDTALAGLGEAVYGAGAGYNIVAYLTISTGTGGVRIVDKNIDSNVIGFEPGRHIIKADDPHKSLGRYVSGNELARIYGKKPEHITDRRIWNEVERYVAYGVYNTIMFWSPHIVVLGGGLILHNALQLQGITKHYEERLEHTGHDVFPYAPPLVRATLGDLGGLYGGLAYIRNRLSHFIT